MGATAGKAAFPPASASEKAAAKARIAGKGDIFEAAASGDLAFLADHLTVDPKRARATNDFRDTPLHIITRGNGKVDACDLLLKYGADANAKNKIGCTPLNCAAYIGKADFCDILLKNGADINAKDNDGNTPLALASRDGRVDACDVLLKNGADVNALTKKGDTPLIHAAYRGHLDICRLLVDQKADLTARSKGTDPYADQKFSEYGTALQAATKSNKVNKVDVVEYLRSIGAPE